MHYKFGKFVSGQYKATDSGKRDVLLRTSDGKYIEGTAQIDPFSKKGVVLLHMKGGRKSDYRELQLLLADAGFSSIAINFRGNENSGTMTDKHNYLAPKYPMFQDLYKDAFAAKEFLIREAGVAPNKVAILGGSVGASTAIRTASKDNNYRAVVLLSPGLTYLEVDSVTDMKRFPNVPTFISYATKALNEDYSAYTIMNLHKNPKKVVIRPVHADFTNGHASSAFKTDPKIMNEIIEFLVRNV